MSAAAAAAAASLEQHLAAAVQDGRIPHAVVCATNRDGMFSKTRTDLERIFLQYRPG